MMPFAEEFSVDIVDAQIHVWGTGLPSNQAHWQVTSFTTEQAVALMDEAGVAAAVIHPPSWDPGSHEMATTAVLDYPGRFAIMGSVDLHDPASAELIAGWREGTGLLGLRWTFLHEPARSWLADGTLEWLWTAAEEAGVPVALLCTDSLHAIGDIAERHPGLRLTVDHYGGRGGNTTLKDHAAMAHMPALLRLAKYENVAVKVTGAPGYSAEAYPFPIMAHYTRQLYDVFGPRRIFWGTDISKMPCTWKACITMFTEEMSWLPEAEYPLVMGQGICDWWGWDRG